MVETFSSLADARISLARQVLAGKPDSAELMFALAYALADGGAYDEFARIFRRAYRLRPLVTPVLDECSAKTISGKAKIMRDRALALIERGVIYSPVVAALAIAETILGDNAAVSRLVDYDRFFRCIPSVKPEGSTGDFYEALAAELRTDLKYYDDPNSRAIKKAWRKNDVFKSDGPASRAIAGEIRRQVVRYIAQLPDEAEHPFIASRPSDYRFEAWAVVSGVEGHHRSHIHSRAWMSGVYYVVRPDISRVPGTDCGWLQVGPPEHVHASPDGWQQQVVAPEPGNLVLMPAYFYHSTRPIGVDQERICIAFDVVSTEFAGAADNSSDY